LLVVRIATVGWLIWLNTCFDAHLAGAPI